METLDRQPLKCLLLDSGLARAWRSCHVKIKQVKSHNRTERESPRHAFGIP